MYFVTTKHPDYVLFCMTPSERAAVGLTEGKVVRLLVQREGQWEIAREWEAERLSHTDFMVAAGRLPEPKDPLELLRLAPPES